MFKLRDNSTPKMDFTCVLRCACLIAHLSQNAIRLSCSVRVLVFVIFIQILINILDLKLLKIKNPAGNYFFQVNNRNIKTRCEISSKLTIKTPARHQWHRSDVFIVNFEHIVLVFLLSTFSR